VRSEIVGEDDVVGLEGGNQELLDIGEETLAVDRAVEQARRFDALSTCKTTCSRPHGVKRAFL